MYCININEDYKRFMSKIIESKKPLDELQNKFGDLGLDNNYKHFGDMTVLKKLDAAAGKSYNSLKEIITAIKSIDSLQVPGLEDIVSKGFPIEIDRWPIFQQYPKFLVGEILNRKSDSQIKF